MATKALKHLKRKTETYSEGIDHFDFSDHHPASTSTHTHTTITNFDYAADLFAGRITYGNSNACHTSLSTHCAHSHYYCTHIGKFSEVSGSLIKPPRSTRCVLKARAEIHWLCSVTLSPRAAARTEAVFHITSYDCTTKTVIQNS